MMRIAQVLGVYYRQRWAIAIVILGIMIWAMVLVAESRSNRELTPMEICNGLGLPVMGVSFWVTSIAKWQFVNPRARLLPGFLLPHLAVLAGWLILGLVLLPCIFGLVHQRLDSLASVTYATVCGACFVWAMHTARPAYMVVGMAAYFSPVAPGANEFWFSEQATFVLARLVATLAGMTAIGSWFVALARLTEESETYIIPTSAQSGTASRMEKSEARRNLAAQLTRSKLAGWAADRWLDPLTSMVASTIRQRQALLGYGQAAAPAWLRTLWMMVIMLVVVSTNWFMVGAHSSGKMGMVLPTISMFALVGPMITSQLLAMRRPRMATELLLPFDRRQYVGGLFRTVRIEVIQFWAVTLLLLAGFAAMTDSEYLRLPWVVFVALGTGAALLPTLGIAMFCALIESGVKRILLLLAGIYFVVSILIAAAAAHVHWGLLSALLIEAGLAGIGLWILLQSHQRWMTAELG